MSDAGDERRVRDISGSPIPAGRDEDVLPPSLQPQPRYDEPEQQSGEQLQQHYEQDGDEHMDTNDAEDTPQINDDDDQESELSDVDEAEFADFDPTTVAIDDRPTLEIDEDAAKTLKASKRKRDGEPKKPKEGKREKKKKSRRAERPNVDGDEYDSGADGEILEGKRRTKAKSSSSRADDGRRQRDRAEERRRDAARMQAINEENMTPEQRRAAQLDRKMDDALKNPNKKRARKGDIDLEQMADDEIADLKLQMEQACRDDNTAREHGQPAVNKLKMLPAVLNVLTRNTMRHTIVDPETNFLLSAKFFLEPLNDGSLPAYNIQRDLLTALERLPIDKECLLSSGIGKVVLYYTKSKRPEIGIKRIAERLLADWSRPILKRSDDYKKRKIATIDYDSRQASLAHRPNTRETPDDPPMSQREMERARILSQPSLSNRARMVSHSASYNVAPRTNMDIEGGGIGIQIGQQANKQFARIVAAQKAAKGGRR